jgi:hypothetical protein
MKPIETKVTKTTNHEALFKKLPKQLCPLDPNFRLMPHQVDDVQEILKSKNRVYANQLGLGKTTSSVVYAKIMAEDWLRDQAEKGTPTTRPMTAVNFYNLFKKRGLIAVDEKKMNSKTAAANILRKSKLHNNESMAKSNLQILILCDSSIVSRWVDDFRKISLEFADRHVWHCDSHLATPSCTKTRGVKYSHLICIVTYTLLEYTHRIMGTDIWIYQRKWGQIIMDEAHKIYPRCFVKRISTIQKPNIKSTENNKKLYDAVFQLVCENYLFVTGTPIQKCIEELYFFDQLFLKNTCDLREDIGSSKIITNKTLGDKNITNKSLGSSNKPLSGRRQWKKVEENDEMFIEWKKKYIISKTRMEAYNMAIQAGDTFAVELLRPRDVKVIIADLGEMSNKQKMMIVRYSKYFQEEEDEKGKLRGSRNLCSMIGFISRIAVSHYLVPEFPPESPEDNLPSKWKGRHAHVAKMRNKKLDIDSESTVTRLRPRPLSSLSSTPNVLTESKEIKQSNETDKSDDNSDEDYFPDKDEINSSDDDDDDTLNDDKGGYGEIKAPPATVRNEAPMIQYIVKVMQRAILEKRKVVIFNSEVRQLLLFKRVLVETRVLKKDPIVFVGGTQNFSTRKELLARFQCTSAEEEPLILVSTRAGCCGIDLSAGTIAIMSNHSFNPIVEIQAMERISRIGQLKDIELHYPRFNGPWSLDEWISAVHRRKLRFAKLAASHLVERPIGFELEILNLDDSDKDGKIDKEEYKLWKNRLNVAIDSFLEQEAKVESKPTFTASLEVESKEQTSFRKRKFDLLYSATTTFKTSDTFKKSEQKTLETIEQKQVKSKI